MPQTLTLCWALLGDQWPCPQGSRVKPPLLPPLQGSQREGLAGWEASRQGRVGPSQETISRRKSGDLGGSWFHLEFAGCLGGSVQTGEVSWSREAESNLLKIDMISMAARNLMGALECKVTGAEVAGTGWLDRAVAEQEQAEHCRCVCMHVCLHVCVRAACSCVYVCMCEI